MGERAKSPKKNSIKSRTERYTVAACASRCGLREKTKLRAREKVREYIAHCSIYNKHLNKRLFCLVFINQMVGKPTLNIAYFLVLFLLMLVSSKKVWRAIFELSNFIRIILRTKKVRRSLFVFLNLNRTLLRRKKVRRALFLFLNLNRTLSQRKRCDALFAVSKI